MNIKKKISPFLILRLLGIALFVFILFRIDLGEMARELQHIKGQYFLFGILFQVMVLSFKGIRWHVMNDGRAAASFWIRSFGRFFESYAIGVVTPGRVGELLKAGHEKNRNEKASSVIRVISERGFDVSIFVLIAVAALFFGEFIQIESISKWLFLILGCVLLVVSFLLLSSQKFLAVLQKIIYRLPGKFSQIDIAGKLYRKGTVIMVFLFSLLSNASYFVSCYFLALSVNLSIPLIDVSAGVAIAGLINMLPVTIMGLGTRELVFLGVFSDLPSASVLAFSITILLVAQFGGGLFSLLLGQIFLFIDRKDKENISK
ncbi:MAG: lysylphosphatidylglycerol synthase transmembrane domain-containing protein [Bacteroidales bacterium]|nr:lysylphosphatidylglycerol synthase transmembrane domain-containing protein [Bacteroidales bacterium]